MYQYKLFGMAMIELLIACILSSGLLSILISIFLVSQHAYHAQLNLQTILNSALNAIDILNDEIKQAGFIGCRRLTKQFHVTSYASYSIKAINRIQENHHHLIVRHMSNPNDNLLENMKDNVTLSVTKVLHFYPGEIAIITDCERGEIFQIESVSEGKNFQIIRSNKKLHHLYKKQADVGKLEVNEYFIEKNMTMNKKLPDGGYALYMKNIKQKKFKLISNIDAMEMKYSLFENNELRDKTAKEVIDWSQIQGVSVRLSLIVNHVKKIWHTYINLR